MIKDERSVNPETGEDDHNPEANYITYDTIDGVEVDGVEVFNAVGQKIGCFRQNEIDFSSYESGVYFLRVTSSEGQVLFEKVIKK